jgi:hypothetical protein
MIMKRMLGFLAVRVGLRPACGPRRAARRPTSPERRAALRSLDRGRRFLAIVVAKSMPDKGFEWTTGPGGW